VLRAAEGQAEEVMLGGGVQPRLWPVEGTDDLWEASLRVRRLDEAVITVLVVPRLAGGDWPTQLTERFIWRGPAAPSRPSCWWACTTPPERPGPGPTGEPRSTCPASASTVSTRNWIGGHDSLWWDQQLPVALGWLLSSS